MPSLSAFPAFARAGTGQKATADAPAKRPESTSTPLSSEALQRAQTDEGLPSAAELRRSTLQPAPLSAPLIEEPPAETPSPRLTKKMNARLQLAAALIEADNDDILVRAEELDARQAAEQAERAALLAAAEAKGKGIRREPAIGPAPLPQLRLASQSAIFAPYRTGPVAGASAPSIISHVRRGSGASQLSVDYLNVKMPTERKYGYSQGAPSSAASLDGGAAMDRSQGASGRSSGVMSFSNVSANAVGSASRAASIVFTASDAGHAKSALADDDDDDEALSDWGVDKFLTEEARQKVSRSRANSTATSLVDVASRRGSVISIGSSAAAPVVPRTRARSDASAAPKSAADLELLAKIKLYRERQEVLPPAMWEGPGPAATEEQVKEHLSSPQKGSTAEPGSPSVLRSRSIVREGSVPSLRAMEARPPAEVAKALAEAVARRESTFGIVGQSWSDQDSDEERDEGGEGVEEIEVGEKAPERVEHAPEPIEQAPEPIEAPPPHVEQGQDPAPTADSQDTQPAIFAGVGTHAASSRRNSGSLLGMASPTFGFRALPQTTIPSRPGTPGSPRAFGNATPLLSVGHILEQDPYAALPLGPSAYPAPSGSRPMSPGPGVGLQGSPSASVGLSTRQLQAMARRSVFPDYYGINIVGVSDRALDGQDRDDDGGGGGDGAADAPIQAGPLASALEPPLITLDNGAVLNLDDDPEHVARAVENVKPKDPLDAIAAAARRSNVRLSALFGQGASEPDLSSVRWGWKKRAAEAMGRSPSVEALTRSASANEIATAAPSVTSDRAALEAKAADAAAQYAAEPVSRKSPLPSTAEDEYVSPARSGPLAPRGIQARLPKTLVMPQPLRGTRAAPRLRLTGHPEPENRRASRIHVPEGFVLHDNRAAPTTLMRQLQVGGASGPKPFFMAPEGDRRYDAVVSDFLRSKDGRRLLNIPAAAPVGIGRRAAAPSTALFRNQLVQHDEDKEGWGWESAPTAAAPDGDKADDDAANSDEDAVPLASLQKKTRLLARRAEKKAAKDKRRRKKARRERRERRTMALRQGLSYQAVGVAEESPSEDEGLSDTTDEGDESDETDGSWNTDDERRWIDDNKPAGKLYGMSLLDVAEERRVKVKAKTRFYGQVELQEQEAAEAAAAANADTTSIAPSAAARSFAQNPIGYNDTRERMQATFGTDMLWAREMAQRRQEEAREAEELEIRRLAEAELQKLKDEKEAKKKAKKQKKQKGHIDLDAPEPQTKLKFPSAEEERDAAAHEETPSGDVSPPRSRTPVNAPTIDFDPVATAGEEPKRSRRKRRAQETTETAAAAEWFMPSGSDSDGTDETDSEEEAERRREAMQRARLSRSLGGLGQKLELPPDAVQDDDDDEDEDDVPLSKLRARAAGPRLSVAAASDEEELPLAAIIAKRKARESAMGKLDLDFSSPKESLSASVSSLPAAGLSVAAAPDDSDSDDDAPLGVRHANANDRLAALAAEHWERKARKRQTLMPSEDSGRVADEEPSSDSDDDAPLGAAHPQAAIIAEQAALIKQLRAEADRSRMSTMLPSFPTMGGSGFLPGIPLTSPSMPHLAGPGMMPMHMPMTMAPVGPASVVGMPPFMGAPPIIAPGSPPPAPQPPQQAAAIDHWRSHVPPDATGTAPGATSSH